MQRIMTIIAAAALLLPISRHPASEEKHMEAKGTFEVKGTPGEATAFEKTMGASRYEVEKIWAGDFVGVSKVEML